MTSVNTKYDRKSLGNSFKSLEPPSCHIIRSTRNVLSDIFKRFYRANLFTENATKKKCASPSSLISRDSRTVAYHVAQVRTT